MNRSTPWYIHNSKVFQNCTETSQAVGFSRLLYFPLTSPIDFFNMSHWWYFLGQTWATAKLSWWAKWEPVCNCEIACGMSFILGTWTGILWDIHGYSDTHISNDIRAYYWITSHSHLMSWMYCSIIYYQQTLSLDEQMCSSTDVVRLELVTLRLEFGGPLTSDMALNDKTTWENDRCQTHGACGECLDAALNDPPSKKNTAPHNMQNISENCKGWSKPHSTTRYNALINM